MTTLRRDMKIGDNEEAQMDDGEYQQIIKKINYYYESSDNDYISSHSDDEYIIQQTSSSKEKNMEICTEPNALYLNNSDISLENICENEFSSRIDKLFLAVLEILLSFYFWNHLYTYIFLGLTMLSTFGRVYGAFMNIDCFCIVFMVIYLIKRKITEISIDTSFGLLICYCNFAAACMVILLIGFHILHVHIFYVAQILFDYYLGFVFILPVIIATSSRNVREKCMKFICIWPLNENSVPKRFVEMKNHDQNCSRRLCFLYHYFAPLFPTYQSLILIVQHYQNLVVRSSNAILVRVGVGSAVGSIVGYVGGSAVVSGVGVDSEVQSKRRTRYRILKQNVELFAKKCTTHTKIPNAEARYILVPNELRILLYSEKEYEAMKKQLKNVDRIKFAIK